MLSGLEFGEEFGEGVGEGDVDDNGETAAPAEEDDADDESVVCVICVGTCGDDSVVGCVCDCDGWGGEVESGGGTCVDDCNEVCDCVWTKC